MFKKAITFLIAISIGYLLFWPVPIEPEAWQPPQNQGFTGLYSTNYALSELNYQDTLARQGPESLSELSSHLIYTGTEDGAILEMDVNSIQTREVATTNGRPLGLYTNKQGTLFIADAYKGIFSYTRGAGLTLLLDQVDGQPISYANSITVADDGVIYFTDASSKFAPKDHGGTYEASLLDIMEHGGHGRLIRFDPANGDTQVLMQGLQFANGVALAEDQSFVLVNETGSYRVNKYWLTGAKAGQSEVILDNLPGFPDNLSRGKDGRFWLGLASPRNDLLDSLAESPALRKMVQRLPAFVRPQAEHYSHVIAFDRNGNVLASLQDPTGTYPVVTGALETDNYLFLSSLFGDKVGYLTSPFKTDH